MSYDAGRELDARIAERIFGYTLDYEFADLHVPPAPHVKELRDGYDEWGMLPHYSTDIADAWLVVERFRADGYRVFINEHLDATGFNAMFLSKHGVALRSLSRFAETAPLAICRAALALTAPKNRRPL